PGLQRVVVESRSEPRGAFPGLARWKPTRDGLQVVPRGARVGLVQRSAERLVQIGARLAAGPELVGRCARHDEAASVDRIEPGCAPEMGAGFLEAALVVRGQSFAVLGGGALASLQADVRLEIGDE